MCEGRGVRDTFGRRVGISNLGYVGVEAKTEVKTTRLDALYVKLSGENSWTEV